MKTEKLKNIFLGIIAINLTFITLIQLEVFPAKIYANESSQSNYTNYGLVPLNENGNVNVEVVGGKVLLGGWSDLDDFGSLFSFKSHPLPVKCK